MFLSCFLFCVGPAIPKGYFEKTKDYEFFYNKPTPPNSKVVSVSIFRPLAITKPKKFKTYLTGLEQGAKSLPDVLPGWTYRVYTDCSFFAYNDNFSQEFKRILSEISNLPHVQIIYFKFPEFLEPDGIHHKEFFGMFARLHALFDKNLKTSLSRNSRIPITKADKEFINKWLETDKQLMSYSIPLVPSYLKKHLQNNDLKISYYDHKTKRIMVLKQSQPVELNVVTNFIFAGLFGSNGKLPMNIWNQILIHAKSGETFDYGADEGALTDILYEQGFLNNNPCKIYFVQIQPNFIDYIYLYGHEKELSQIASSAGILDSQKFITKSLTSDFTPVEAKKIERNITNLIKQNEKIALLYTKWKNEGGISIGKLSQDYDI